MEVNHASEQLNGWTALHWAAQGEQHALAMTEALLPFVWDVDRRATAWEVTALHLACLHGNSEAAARLLRAGADPMLVAGKPVISNWGPRVQAGPRAIHLAARHGHTSAIEVLLRAGVPATTPDGDNCQALHIACLNAEATTTPAESLTSPCNPPAYSAHHHVEAVSFLLGKREVQAAVDAPSRHGLTPLMMACQAGSLELVQLLLGRGKADPRIRTPLEQCCLHAAAAVGSTAVATFLVEEVPETLAWKDHLGNTPLHLAAKAGHRLTVDALLKKGAGGPVDPAACPMNLMGESVEYLMSRRNGMSLFQQKAEQERNDDMLHVVRRGTLAAVTAAVRAAPDAVLRSKAADITQDSLLHAACRRCTDSEQIVSLLLSLNAPIDIVNSYGRTALQLAILHYNDKAAQLLVDNGADMSSLDTAGHAALHMAAGTSNLGMVQYLLQNGADVNRRAAAAAVAGGAEASGGQPHAPAVDGHNPHQTTAAARSTPLHVAAASLAPQVMPAARELSAELLAPCMSCCFSLVGLDSWQAGQFDLCGVFLARLQASWRA